MNRISKIILTLILCFLSYLVILMFSIRFEDRFAHVVYADGQILNAQVSADEQWRIKCEDQVPLKLETCLKYFEDQYFDFHFGINPVSLVKAAYANFKAGKIVRGGSTLTMQLARIHEGNKTRSYFQKLKEIFLTMALELKYSKEEILKLYAQHAPYGGNTVGFCAATQRYYGKDAHQLTWSEAATLAVLPNSPSKIYPGKGQKDFFRKRNFLLKKLLESELIDSTSYRLAILEDLPKQSRSFEGLAPHLMQELKLTSPEKFNFHTSLDYSLQKNVLAILNKYQEQYSSINDIQNISAIVLRSDGTVASYVGNTNCKDCAGDVDVLNSLRSPGSTLKPFLYSLALDEGMITTKSLLKDIPVFYNGYSPGNFDRKFRGIIQADKALTQSLNIPAINLLSDYGSDSFLDDLRKMGFNHFYEEAEHYGLSIILGGAEINGREMAQAYLNLTQRATDRNLNQLSFFEPKALINQESFPISSAAAYQTLEMLKGVNRPFNQEGWKFFNDVNQISWKTGTSFGFRDAWSVGSNENYTILVWVGNANGEGRPGLTGIQKAAPVLFDLFELLPSGKDLRISLSEFKEKTICAESGFAIGPFCEHKVQVDVPITVKHIEACTFHQFITTNISGDLRLNKHCDIPSVSQSKFILDPITNSYHQKFYGISHALPPYSPECKESSASIEIVYPTPNAEILLPVDIDEKKQILVSKALVSSTSDSLFWFLNSRLQTITYENHSIEFNLDPGDHLLTLISSDGTEKNRHFRILE